VLHAAEGHFERIAQNPIQVRRGGRPGSGLKRLSEKLDDSNENDCQNLASLARKGRPMARKLLTVLAIVLAVFALSATLKVAVAVSMAAVSIVALASGAVALAGVPAGDGAGRPAGGARAPVGVGPPGGAGFGARTTPAPQRGQHCE
jgi:hypothetical protein